MPGSIARWAPLVIVLGLLALGYYFGLHRFFSLDALRRYQATLDLFVEAHAIGAALLYVVIYVAAVALSFPGAGFLTIAGGFLFGALFGSGLAVIAATIGATLIFLIARTSLGNLLADKAGPRLKRLRDGFQREGFSYLLFLRLVPLFPFWLVNLAAALFGMRLVTYVAATAIGILPGTFVFAFFGKGLRTALASDGRPLSTELFIGLLLLGLLTLVPVIVRRWRRGNETRGGASS